MRYSCGGNSGDQRGTAGNRQWTSNLWRGCWLGCFIWRGGMYCNSLLMQGLRCSECCRLLQALWLLAPHLRCHTGHLLHLLGAPIRSSRLLLWGPPLITAAGHGCCTTLPAGRWHSGLQASRLWGPHCSLYGGELVWGGGARGMRMLATWGAWLCRRWHRVGGVRGSLSLF